MLFAYLSINILSILFPLIFSFYSKLNFINNIKPCLKAITIISVFFIIWDIVFTERGIWGFNSKYVTGVYLYNLPIEEVLFFICIPYACIFTYHCGHFFFSETKIGGIEKIITPLILLLCITLSTIYFNKPYTTTTLISLLIVLPVLQYILKVKWLPMFYISYAILLIPFLIVNGILTGAVTKEPIVWYSANGIIGKRIVTIPIEDTFYCMLLLILNVAIYEYNLKKVLLYDKKISH